VLHDGQLHHARGRLLMRQRRYDDYCEELRFNHPAADTTIPELGIAGLLGELTYQWPMRRLVVDTARCVLVHNQWLAQQIRDEQPHVRIDVLDMGVPAREARADARPRVRARHGLAADDIVFLALGGITPEKRIGPALRSLAAVAGTVPNVRLLLVGEPVGHYDPRAQAAALGIADRVTITGFVSDEDVAEYLAAADVCLCMRWPTSRETSAAWLRCLAAGVPTIITDLIHTVDIPAYDPRSWTLSYAGPSTQSASSPPPEPACVSIDLLDEHHSLRLAMRRLATDAQLREAVGRGGFELWTERFTLQRMIDAYRHQIVAAMRVPAPDPSNRERLPAHIRADGTEHASTRLREMGVSDARIADIWNPPA
jgi:glycosyltransferase involved in cell wall biosynthesis